MKNTFLMIIFVAAIIGSYFFVDFNSLFNDARGEVKFAQQSDDCDLHEGPCKITLEDGTSFNLEVYPKDIPLMKPVTFKITSENYNKDIISIDVYAKNMNMGTQVIKLKKTSDNNYESNVILPTCIRGNMKWNADIIIDKLSHRVGAKFKFKTDY
jgi:hypothetical protein